MPLPRSSSGALAAACALIFFSTAALASASTADLAVSQGPEIDGKSHVGVTATYTFHVNNIGPDATEATLTDELGEAEAFVSATPSQGSCTQAVPITCALGVLAPGADVVVQIKVTYTRESDYNAHSYRVAGAADNTDPDFNNDGGGVSFPVVPPPEEFVETPEVETGGWSRTQASLVLDAELSPYGTGTYYFEYGKTRAYGKKSEVKKIKGEDRLERKIKIDGLDMKTKYHYRVVMVVGGKAYRGKDKTGTTLGKLLYPEITIKATDRGASTTTYAGSVGDGYADAPGACKGTITMIVYTEGGDVLSRKTTVNVKTCEYKITIPFGTTDARRYGPKGKGAYVMARFSGSKAVAPAGSSSDRP